MNGQRKVRAAAALAALATLSACDRGEPGRVPPPAEPVDVRVSAPAVTSSVTTVAATVRSTDEAEIATRTSGTVRRVRAEVGMAVRAGDTLALLDASDVTAAIESARAEAERASAYYRRIAALAEDGAATAQELDDARARAQAAEASLRNARGQLGYVVIRAPFAGVVAARHAGAGDLAVPGMPIVTLVRPGSLKVEADVPGAVASRIRAGDSATVRLGEAGTAVAARVSRVSPALDRQSRRARVELIFVSGATGSLPPPGSFARIEIPDPDRSSLWIPADAIVERGQLRGVYLAEAEHARLRWVRPGERRGDAVEVLAGLEPEARVVRAPGEWLSDGAPLGEVTLVEWTPEAAPPGGVRRLETETEGGEAAASPAPATSAAGAPR